MRRFTRLTNAFSKKLENLAAAVSLHFAYYNYCRTHQSLGGQTPAIAAGLEDHVWTVNELIDLLASAEATPIKRGTYRKTRERKESCAARFQTDPLPSRTVDKFFTNCRTVTNVRLALEGEGPGCRRRSRTRSVVEVPSCNH